MLSTHKIDMDVAVMNHRPNQAESSSSQTDLRRRISTHLQDDLVVLHTRAGKLDIREYEQEDRTVLISDLVPFMLNMVEDGEALIIQALELYDAAAAGEPDHPEVDCDTGAFFLNMDALATGTNSAQEAADIAFMASRELVKRHERLLSIDDSHDSWEIISRCGSCLRRVRKACEAIENAVAIYNLQEPKLTFVSGLETSLQTRRAYAKFWRAVKKSSANGDIHARLRGGAIAVARLVGRDIYPTLRISDRSDIRNLQHRLLVFLRQTAERIEVDGKHLWQDLSGFAELLASVNNREELVVHDRGLVEESLIFLFGAPPDQPPSPGVREQLESLYGRDGSIDDLLDHKQMIDNGQWQKLLAPVGQGLGVHIEDSPGAE